MSYKANTDVVTMEHIKLLSRMWVSHYNIEFGAPVVDCKRPYGNGDVYNDIAEILEIEYESYSEDEKYVLLEKEFLKLHESMQFFIQLIFENPYLSPKELIGAKLESKYDRMMSKRNQQNLLKGE